MSATTQAASSLLLAAVRRDRADVAEHPSEYLEALTLMLAEELQTAPNAARRTRSLAYNLTQNHQLRRSLLTGAVTPKAVCAMDVLEWASAGVKRDREEAAERREQKVRVALTGGELFSRTHSVVCPECGCRMARFKHLGTDMRDWHGRKNEVWGTKHDDDDGLDCLIICMSCDFQWHAAAPEQHISDDGEGFEVPRRKDRVICAS